MGRSRLLARLATTVAVAVLITALLACSERAHSAVYRCPMHPQYTAATASDCPACGMRLVIVAEDRATDHADAKVVAADARVAVTVAPDMVERAGIASAVAFTGRVVPTVRTAGTVIADPEHVRRLVARFGGWIDEVRVFTAGAPVRAGDVLFTVYAPELVPIQEEYIRYLRVQEGARTAAGEEARRRADGREEFARQRIERYGLPDTFLRELERSGTSRTIVPIQAPGSGALGSHGLFAGRRIEAGDELLTLLDVSTVGIEAEIFESHVADVRPGTEAVVRAAFAAEGARPARVIAIDPVLDSTTRTAHVRLRARNEDAALRPGMSATVDLVLPPEDGVIVPSDAVIDTGTRRVVYVMDDAGGFAPREVEIGARAGGMTRIASGLAAGERVAVRGNFLIDAESRLRAIRVDTPIGATR